MNYIYVAFLSSRQQAGKIKWRRKLQIDHPVHVTTAIFARVTVYVIKLVT